MEAKVRDTITNQKYFCRILTVQEKTMSGNKVQMIMQKMVYQGKSDLYVVLNVILCSPNICVS